MNIEINQTLKKIYEEHHQQHREEGFSVMKKERGKIFESVIGKGKSVLDLGCRDGALTRHFTAGNKVVGVDIDGQLLKKAQDDLGIETHCMDLYGDWKELGDRKFDAIVAGEVLEHLYHPEEVIKKAKKYLSKEGVFVGSVPNAFTFKHRLRYLMGKKKNTPLEDPTHINQFSNKDLELMLRKHFSDVTVIGLGRYHRLARLMPGMFAFDLVFICHEVFL